MLVQYYNAVSLLNIPVLAYPRDNIRCLKRYFLSYMQCQKVPLSIPDLFVKDHREKLSFVNQQIVSEFNKDFAIFKFTSYPGSVLFRSFKERKFLLRSFFC